MVAGWGQSLLHHWGYAPSAPLSSRSLHRPSTAFAPRGAFGTHQILLPTIHTDPAQCLLGRRKPQVNGIGKLQAMAGWDITPTMTWDAVALGAMLAISLACVKIFDVLRYRGYMSQTLSRKMVHVVMGALFCSLWALFSDATYSRYLALLLPAIHFFKLLLVGLGIIKDKGLVSSITRENKESEVLKGPLLYIAVLSWVTYAYWRETIVGFIAVSMMCGGDGLADIVGRRIGKHKWAHNQAKSVEGSIAMLAGGALMSFGLLALHKSQGYLALGPGTIPVVLVSALTATVAESFATDDTVDDNLVVPFAAAGAAHLMQRII